MRESVYARLAVRPVINGMGTYTLLGWSIMPPEVVAAMVAAARRFVSMTETGGSYPEVILQNSHKSGYEAQMQLAGARLVWVETRAELDRAIGDQAGMLFFLNCHEPLGTVSRSLAAAMPSLENSVSFRRGFQGLDLLVQLSGQVLQVFGLLL